MGLFLSDIRNNIRKTLDYRQQNNINLRKNWLNNKTTWTRLTSMVSIDGDNNIRNDNILYNGTTSLSTKKTPSGYKELYDEYDRPLPGITNVSVTNKGSMGSIREATINFTVWSIQQLNTFEKLYMTPGMSLLLEWGWNIMADDNNTNVYSDLHKIPPISDRCMTKKIYELVDKYNGHYDGMQGPISTFSWSIRPDGGFDCTTTIQSVGGMFLDMNIHSTSKKLTKPNVDNEHVVDENIKSTIRATVDRINGNDDKELIIANKMMGIRIDIESAKYEEGDFNDIDKKEDHQYYVTWEYFEKYIINNNLSLRIKNNTECGDDVILTNKNFQAHILNNQLKNDTGGSIEMSQQDLLPKLNSNNTKLSFNGIHFSADPLICILPFGQTSFKDNKFLSKSISSIPNELVIDIVDGQYFKLQGILLNLRLILNAVNSTKTLNELLTSILNSINDANVNTWNLGSFVNENEPDVIQIVDYNFVERDKLNPYILKVYNKNSIVKNVDISTNVDEEIKAQIMYGTNANNTNVSNSDSTTSQYNFYGANLTNLATVDLGLPRVNSETDLSDGDSNENVTEWSESEYNTKLLEAKKRVYGWGWNGRTDENVVTLKTIMAKCIADNFGRDVKTDTNVKNNKKMMFLPLKMSTTLDGIGGIQFGNIIGIDYLPDRYKNKAIFQITNVSHTITPSGWDTSIETIMRVNNEDDINNVNYDSPSFAKNNYTVISDDLDNNAEEIINNQQQDILNENKPSNVVWFIDPGHGINTNPSYKRYPPNDVSDNSGVPQLLEYKFNRDVMKQIIKLGNLRGLTTIPTITTNNDVSIWTRSQIINKFIKNNPNKQVIVVSIHGNAQRIKYVGQRGTAGGVMTIISTPTYQRKGKTYKNNFTDKSYEYAKIFYDELDTMWINTINNKRISSKYRIDKRHNVGIVNYTKCPAILTENGFYTTPVERAFMLSDRGQKIIAQTHIDSMMKIEKLLVK